MADSNPYDTPPQQKTGNAAVASSSGNLTSIGSYAVLGLRLLGVMFLIDGASNFLGTVANAAVQWSQLDIVPDSPDVLYYDSYVIGYFVTHLLYFNAGLYLLLNPRPLVNLFFLPSKNAGGDGKS